MEVLNVRRTENEGVAVAIVEGVHRYAVHFSRVHDRGHDKMDWSCSCWADHKSTEYCRHIMFAKDEVNNQ